MQLSFPEIHIGEKRQAESLTIYPLFTESPINMDYLLAGEAIAKGLIQVEEVTEAGTVNTLQVKNNGDIPVLFLEGEELIGAKQNRILNTSVLVAAQTHINIPVSCVEEGRWGYTSRNFAASTHHSPSSLRHALKKSVSSSLQRNSSHTSDQRAIWQEVEKSQRSLGVSSRTKAQADTYASYQEQVERVQQEIPYVDGATGMIAAIHGQVVAFELFDRPQTCQQVWPRLLAGWYLDARSQKEAQSPSTSVDAFYNQLTSGAWNKAQPVGEGDEFRMPENNDDIQASALFYGGSLLHSSAVIR